MTSHTSMNSETVDELLYFAALFAAKKLKIAQVEEETTENLAKVVISHDPSLGADLKAFFNAYRGWFEFIARIDAEGKAGNLSPSESVQHVELVKARDKARNQFIAALNDSV